MELNKIYRYFGITTENLYAHMKEKFTEAFTGFDGVSFEVVPDYLPEMYKIYLNAEKTVYILLTKDTVKFIVNGYEKEIYKIGASVSYRQYNIIRTAYGVAFTNIGTTNDATEILNDDRYFTSFFTVGNPNVFIHTLGQSINGGTSQYDYICSNLHAKYEEQSFYDRIITGLSVRTKLFNAGSTIYPVDCEHLYRIAYSDGKVGKIKVGDKYFISGVRYALEYDPNDDGKEV